MIDLQNTIVLFDQDVRCMYVIHDEVSKCEMTDVLTASNDVVAVKAFLDMLEKQHEKFNDFSVIRLVRIGAYSTKEHEITNNHAMNICTSEDDVNEFYKQLCERAKAMNTEEE